MSTTTRIDVPARLAGFFTLSRLLEQLERSPRAVNPDQYRALVARITAEFERIQMDETLGTLLAWLPAASEVYENLNYAHAGLCRSSLKEALEAEIAMRELLTRVGARPAA